MESFVDELALKSKKDPLELRRRLLRKHPRPLGVLNRAAQKAGWGKPLPKGHHRGIAVHDSFGSFIAQVAEVSVTGDQINIHRVVCAVDCGICVNPASVAAQMEGAVAFGPSATLYADLTFKHARLPHPNSPDYPPLPLH